MCCRIKIAKVAEADHRRGDEHEVNGVDHAPALLERKHQAGEEQDQRQPDEFTNGLEQLLSQLLSDLVVANDIAEGLAIHLVVVLDGVFDLEQQRQSVLTLDSASGGQRWTRSRKRQEG